MRVGAFYPIHEGAMPEMREAPDALCMLLAMQHFMQGASAQRAAGPAEAEEMAAGILDGDTLGRHPVAPFAF